jgi:hypothetical protein
MTSVQQQKELYFLRWGSFEEVCEKYFHVEHRDRAGEVVPFKLNAGQRLAWGAVKKALRLNLEMQVEAVRQGGQSYIPKLKQRIQNKQPIGEWEIGLRLVNGKARRGGFTTLWDHVGFRRILTCPNYKIGLFAQDDKTAPELFAKVTLSYDAWPARQAALRPQSTYRSSNRFELENSAGCSVRTAGAKNTQHAGARGWKFDFLHLSEYAWYQSYADVNQIRTVARPHHWIIYESTANGVGNPFHVEWERAAWPDDVRVAWENRDAEFFSEWNGTYRFFFPWFKDSGNTIHVYDYERQQLQESLTEYEQSLMAQFPKDVTLAHIKWRRDTISRIDDPSLEPEEFFSQEFPATPEEMFQNSSRKVFDQQRIIEALKVARRSAPVWRGVVSDSAMPEFSARRSANLKIYEPPDPAATYVCAVDCSHGVGRDFTVANILNRHDGMALSQAAVFRSNRINPAAAGHIVTMLCELFYDAYLIIETYGGGHQVIQTAFKANHYTNMYVRRNLDAAALHIPDARLLGFTTSPQSRSRVIDAALGGWRDGRLIVRDETTLLEMAAFEEDDKGKLQAPAGQFDDCVMSLCLGVWAHEYAAPSIKTVKGMRTRKPPPGTGLRHQLSSAEVTHEEAWGAITAALDKAAKKNRNMAQPWDLPYAPDP